MKVKFFCIELVSGDGIALGKARSATVMEEEPKSAFFLNEYLLSILGNDFSDQAPFAIKQLLTFIELVESGKIDSYEFTGDTFIQHISCRWVRFEHAVFGNCAEWPSWCCPLTLYKSVLAGYLDFIAMPLEVGTIHIVDLPEFLEITAPECHPISAHQHAL